MAKDFWAQKLGNNRPPAPPQPVPQAPQQASQGPWWRTPTPTHTQPPTQAHRQPQAMDTSELEGDRLRQAAIRQEAGGDCPDCFGKNYMMVGTQATRNGSFQVMRCYDCGYPIKHSTSGIGSVSQSGPHQRARQVSTANNFNPAVIVARVGE